MVFFFNDTATTAIYTYLHTLSLHDALPIYWPPIIRRCSRVLWPVSWEQWTLIGHFTGSRTGIPPMAVARRCPMRPPIPITRSEEHTSELKSLMRISYAVFCLKKKKKSTEKHKF